MESSMNTEFMQSIVHEDLRIRIDDNLLRSIITLYLQEHPEKTQADVAEYLHTTPNALSRFIRIDTVKSKSTWLEPILQLCLEINYEDFATKTIRLIHLLEEMQLGYFWNQFKLTLSKDYLTEALSFSTPEFYATRRLAYARQYSGLNVSIHMAEDSSALAHWCFAVFGGKETLGTDVMGILSELRMTSPIDQHIVLVVEGEKAYQDVETTLKRTNLRGDRAISITLILFDKAHGIIVSSYTDGDFGLAKRSEQGSGTSTVPSAAPQ